MSVICMAFVTWFLSAMCSCSVQQNTSLILVQMIFRHGDRAPKFLYPNDPNPESFWTEGLGELTMLGKKQHYALGKYLRSLYGNFITSRPKEIYVDSSYANRCQKSAIVNLAAFFEPTQEQRFNSDFGWQPIPVHYLPIDVDRFLHHDSYCPLDTSQILNFFQSPEYIEGIKRNMDMLLNLSNCSGMDLSSYKSAMNFYETVAVEKKYGLIIPDCVKPYLSRLQVYAHDLQYAYINNPITHRLRTGPYLERLIKNMKKKISGNTPDMKVYQSYSHAANIVILLEALGVFDFKYPPYCSGVAFELHEAPNGSKTVRLLHFNSPDPAVKVEEPRVLILGGCSEFCPLEHFADFTKHLIPEDWVQECTSDDELFY